MYGPITTPKHRFDVSFRRLNIDRIVDIVKDMIDLHKKQHSAKSDHDKIHVQRQIDATDNGIDKLIYTLYGLTDEEIRIVEGK